jgi:hypothetical protein
MSESKYSSSHLEFLRTQKLSQTFVDTLDDIEGFGWQAMLISGDTSNRFAYSIGIHDMFGFPELIVVGLPQDVAHRAMNYALQEMQKGIDLTEGRHREIVGEVEVKFQPVDPKWKEHVMCRADWFYCGDTFPALQMIYPDIENRFQGEEGFNEYFLQPILAPGTEEGTREHDFWAVNDPSSSISRWKFPGGPHTGAFLSKTVNEKQESVTYVSHDLDDGAWQFLGDKMDEGGGPVLSCLHHLIDNDPTLEELHDLPVGWYATREDPGAPWQRFEHPPSDETTAEDEPSESPLPN